MILRATKTQLAMSSIAKREQHSPISQHETVMTARAYLLYHRRFLTLLEDRLVVIFNKEKSFDRHLYKSRLAAALLVTRTKLTIRSTAPRIQFIIIAQCQRVEPTRRYLFYCFVSQVCDYLRCVNIFINTMSALAFIITLTATAPSIHRAILIQCHTVEIPTAYLSDLNM